MTDHQIVIVLIPGTNIERRARVLSVDRNALTATVELLSTGAIRTLPSSAILQTVQPDESSATSPSTTSAS
jgi:hypothetical protein